MRKLNKASSLLPSKVLRGLRKIITGYNEDIA